MSECVVSQFSSRACERGIKGCDVIHSLKPCPFCGEDASITDDDKNFLNIGCSDIDCIGSDLEWVSPGEGEAELAKAIDAWNTRTAPQNEKE